jgi:hypothetical protein
MTVILPSFHLFLRLKLGCRRKNLNITFTPDIALEAMANLLHAEFDQQLAPIEVELLTIRKTVNNHSLVLDIIVKSTANG